MTHPSQPDEILPAPEKAPRKYDFAALEKQIRLDRQESAKQQSTQVNGKLPRFRDPVLENHEVDLAGYATFADGDISWVALVEHNGAAIHPTERLNWRAC